MFFSVTVRIFFTLIWNFYADLAREQSLAQFLNPTGGGFLNLFLEHFAFWLRYSKTLELHFKLDQNPTSNSNESQIYADTMTHVKFSWTT